MNYIHTIIILALLAACTSTTNEDKQNITSKFRNTWNIHEDVFANADGTITYEARAWGGIVAYFNDEKEPVDWSGYDKLIFELAQPTTTRTQVMINDKMASWATQGVTRLECYLAALDVKDVKQVALQSEEPATIIIKRVYLTNATGERYNMPLWEGVCDLGNWTGGFAVDASRFATAREGDILELVYTTDTSNPSVTYWQVRTSYSSTNTPLEGNANELNEWGCATVGKGTTSYRIALTAQDVKKLNIYGLYVNGYYTVVTRCNLLQ